MFNNMEVVLDHNEPDEEEILWVKEFQQKYPNRLKHIIVEKVDPIGTSMNRCIQESSGDFLTIWNVDDLRTPNSLELQYNALKDSNYGLAYGNYLIVKSFGATHGKFIEHSKFPNSELTRSMIIGPFFMFKKMLLQKSGYFDEQLTSGADFDLAIRLAFNTKPFLVKENLGYYLNEGKGASTRPNSKQPIDRTVIELRYGIFDKLDYDYIPDTIKFNIPFIKEFRNYNSVSQYISDYDLLIYDRKNKYFKKGILRYAFRKVFFVKELTYFIKKTIKKMIKA